MRPGLGVGVRSAPLPAGSRGPAPGAPPAQGGRCSFPGTAGAWGMSLAKTRGTSPLPPPPPFPGALLRLTGGNWGLSICSSTCLAAQRGLRCLIYHKRVCDRLLSDGGLVVLSGLVCFFFLFCKMSDISWWAWWWWISHLFSSLCGNLGVNGTGAGRVL